MDDAGVVKLTDDIALVSTIDIFPPVVDDPYWFGRIAAANSLSDVYAMGARPVCAVNFVGYPLAELGGDILQRILEGAFAAIEEADCAMAGGHSIKDNEVKFGLAVTGVVHPDRVITNAAAHAGDHIVLTKPLGLGCLTTALKQGAVTPEHLAAGHEMMARLNKHAAEAMIRAGTHATTDVTGFGLVGHLFEMADGSGLSAHVRANDVPVLDEARPYVDPRYSCGGSQRNAEFAHGRVDWDESVSELQRLALFDVQTSGGLLISVEAGRAQKLVEDLREGGDSYAAVIGEMLPQDGPTVRVC